MAAYVYLIHMDSRINHCQHYLGYCAAESVNERFDRHRAGNGSRLLRESLKRGIDFHVVRVWECNDWREARNLEVFYKRKKKSFSKLCPVCNQKGDQNVRS